MTTVSTCRRGQQQHTAKSKQGERGEGKRRESAILSKGVCVCVCVFLDKQGCYPHSQSNSSQCTSNQHNTDHTAYHSKDRQIDSTSHHITSPHNTTSQHRQDSIYHTTDRAHHSTDIARRSTAHYSTVRTVQCSVSQHNISGSTHPVSVLQFDDQLCGITSYRYLLLNDSRSEKGIVLLESS